MQKSVRAVFEDGVFRPLDRLRGIAEHGEVRLIVRDAPRSPHSPNEPPGVLPAEDAEAMVRTIEEELENASIESGSHGSQPRETLKQLASFLRLVACLTDLDQLEPQWNTYDAESPDKLALRTSLRILRILYSMDALPDKVLPLADGGVALVYNRGSLYGSFECFNDGEIAAGISNRSDLHQAWDVDPAGIADSAKRINAFLNG